VTGAAGLVGREGRALGRLDPEGPVRVGNEIWRALSASPVESGGAVEIMGIEGLTLRVRPLAKEA
jgi:membrane-bound ClpP family serine protease